MIDHKNINLLKIYRKEVRVFEESKGILTYLT
jgi:hypothetical protein